MVLIWCDTQLTICFLLPRNVVTKQRTSPFRTAGGVDRTLGPRENPDELGLAGA